jgi:GT2 family glycosyltransferase
MTSSAGVGAVSVVIAAHDERRWPHLLEAVRSTLAQAPAPSEIIVVIDHNEALRERVCAEFPGITVLANRSARGASGTRNTGASHARTALVAFLDDDAAARPDWLHRLIAPFSDPAVVGTGGGVDPVWQAGRPRWFPAEFNWVVGASYTGMPETQAPIRNVWSENMAVRRDAFAAVGGFRVGFGKLGDRSRPEDTDLCIRMAELSPAAHWVHVPHALADHQVPAYRSTFRFFLRRCYHEGRGKIEMARQLTSSAALGSERAYLYRTLPRGFAHGIAAAFRGQLQGAGHAMAIVAGTLAVLFGAGLAALTSRPPARRAQHRPQNAIAK